MPAGLGFIVQAILGMMGSLSLLHVGALSVRLSEGFLVLMAVCSVRSSCVLYLVVVSMVVLDLFGDGRVEGEGCCQGWSGRLELSVELA